MSSLIKRVLLSTIGAGVDVDTIVAGGTRTTAGQGKSTYIRSGDATSQGGVFTSNGGLIALVPGVGINGGADGNCRVELGPAVSTVLMPSFAVRITGLGDVFTVRDATVGTNEHVGIQRSGAFAGTLLKLSHNGSSALTLAGAGTFVQANAITAFAGDFIHLGVDGISQFKVSGNGNCDFLGATWSWNTNTTLRTTSGNMVISADGVNFMQLKTNGQTWINIASNGNVGVRDATFSSQKMQFSNTSIIDSAAGTLTVGTAANTDLILKANNVTRATITPGGAFRSVVLTFGTLPAAPTVGDTCFISDSSVVVFNAAAAAGGAALVACRWNGAAWLVC